MAIGGVCSGFGLLLSYLCATARATSSMAIMGLFPRPLNRAMGYISARGIPTVSIVFISVLTAVFSVFLDFSELVTVSSFFYAARLLFVLIALPLLRFRYPSLERPYQIPVGPVGMSLLVLFPALFCVANLIACAHLSMQTLVLGPGLAIGLFVLSAAWVHIWRPEGFHGVIDDTLQRSALLHQDGHAAEGSEKAERPPAMRAARTAEH